MSVLHAALALVAAQRLAELALAARNTRLLKARGAYEIDAAVYPLFVALHLLWLLALLLLVPADAAPSWPLLAGYGLLQLARVWVVASLGERWTTRLVLLPGAPLRRRGPYRWCRHPNYLVVAAEIALLPLAFGAVGIALVFTVLNLLLLLRRVDIEDRALHPESAALRR